MGKTKNTPPLFLQQKLDDKTFTWVKGKVKDSIAGERVKGKGKGLPDNAELLRRFFKLLAFKSKKFKNIKDDALATTYPGVGQIYDMLRKRNKPQDQEKETPQSKKKTPGQKEGKQTESTKKQAD